MRPVPLSLVALILAGPVWAEVPRVAADTAVVHSLTSMVMGDLGSPSLIVPPGTSPHDASLSPSEAQTLVDSDLILWTGPDFLPWMGEAITSLAPDTPALPLLETEGWEPLPLRKEAHLLGHEDEHEEHAHEGEEHGAEEHREDHGHGHAHAEGALDPHAWLDADVAAAWLAHIAGALSEVDPENAETYGRNAAEASERLQAIKVELQGRLGPLAGAGYAVGHDAYQYLERAMGLPAHWAVMDASGQDPAPRDVSALREAVAAGEVGCLILDAESDPAWADTLGEGNALRTATVDPDGVFLEPGPELYPTLLRDLGEALESCLGA